MLFKGWSRKGKQPERQLRRITASGLYFDISDPPPAERELVQYLKQLTDEDLAEEDDGRVLVRWPAIFRLFDDPYHIASIPLLNLPQPSELHPALTCKGSLSDAGFALALSWLNVDGRPVRDPVDRNGACVTVWGTAFLLSSTTYEFAEAVAAFGRRPTGNRQSNERDWGRIRALALKAGAKLDGFLGKTIILTPDKLDLGLRRENVEDMTVVEVMPLVDGAPPARWVRTFDAYGAVQPHYDITTESGELIRIIPDDAVRTVLAEIKQMPGRRISGRRAEAFLRNPYAALGEDVAEVIPPEAFERARRAAGVAFFSFTPAIDHDDYGHVAAIRLELSSDLDDTPPIDDITLMSRPDAADFAAALAQAAEDKAPSLKWRRCALELRGDAVDALALIRSALDQTWTGEPVPDSKSGLSYADVFDLSRYAERVEGIGAAQKFFSPYIARKDEKLDWIPEIIAPVISWMPPGGDAPVQFELGDSELDLLAHHVETASMEGREVISVPGWPAPIQTQEAGTLVSIFKEAMADAASGKLPVQRRDAGPVEKPAAATLQIKGNIDATDYAEQCCRLLDFDTATPPELPNALLPTTLLKTHQSVGVAWLQHLWRLTPDVRGCIFADDMGLGKTLQMLTLIAWYLQTRTSTDPVLIVAPVSLLENWNGEIKRFFRPDFANVLTLVGNVRKTLKASQEEIEDTLKDHGLRRFLKPDWIKDRDIVLTTYETMRDYEFSFSMVRWGIMVCDEAQKIKTPSALVTRASKAQNARFKIACTGTPVENNLADLWCLFDFVQPGLLGALNAFCKEYRRPIEAETEEQKQAVQRLRRLIEPQILRRMKHEVADLPPKTSDAACRSLSLSSGQSILYSQGVDSYRAKQEIQEKAAAGGQGNVALLGHLHKLRMICAAPPAPDLRLAEYCKLSPKMAWLIEKLSKIRGCGEKVIIFTEFRDIQRMLQRYIGDEFGIRVAVVNGDTSVSGSGSKKSRQGIIDGFQSSTGFNVIILSTTAVGFGVNVQAANHVIHYTRSWNPAKEDQATDRAYRIGQDKQVFVYCPTVTSERFITFEAKLDALLEAKRRLAGDMLNGSDDIALREWEDVVKG